MTLHLDRRFARAIVLAVACATACSSGPDESASAGPAEWRLEPAATFAAPTDSGWVRLKAVVADRDGNAFVLDEGAAQIHVYDSVGGHLRTLGRSGAGPAEFAGAYGMGLGWIGDTLAVLDAGNARLSRLTREGGWVGSWPVQRISGTGVGLDQSGAAAVYAPAVRPDGGKLQSLLVRYTAAGPGDTLVVPPRPENPPGAVVCPFGGGIRFFAIPFSPGILSTAGPGGELVTAPSGGYRISFVRAGGDTVRHVTGTAEPLAVSDSEWTAGMAEYRAFREKNPNANCNPTDPARVRTKPILQQLAFDDAGTLWVERRSADGSVLEAFDGAGRLTGRVAAPAHDPDIAPYVRAGRLYVITSDEATGDQQVRSYRIVRR